LQRGLRDWDLGLGVKRWGWDGEAEKGEEIIEETKPKALNCMIS